EDQGYSKFSSIESIRVKTDDLDKLLNLVGELVISKGQLNEVIMNKTSSVKHTLGTVDRISLELQDIVTKIRMVPAERVLNRFPRLVRDLSREQGKEIKLVMEGKEIELDRKILEEIGEPLIHLLRNAVDHGIEAPMVREACGKDRVGFIRIVAERNQENILIRVCDDGAGIDPQRIKAKALEAGLFSSAELEAMSDKQLVNLIMINGLTTSEDVTSISGRGVGMNIVKTKIEKLGGSIVIESVMGEGTEFLLKLPLTLSILKAILIECAGEVYAVPMSFVEDIEVVERSIVQNLGYLEAVRVGGRTIRVVDLRRLLGVGAGDSDVLHLLIVKNEGDRFGLVVDSVLGMREIMTKKLWDSLQRIRGISGVTILGDGRVIIVLDPVSIYNDGLARGLA
ncbi:chemotaxis protein CheA, partial [archaeon]|nr:chemotaxis protein CheA [archaeon]